MEGNPKDTAALLSLQNLLVKRILYAERQVRRLREVQRACRRRLGQLSPRLTKAEAAAEKEALEEATDVIEDYRRAVWTFRNVGDGLAFTYLDKWDVKVWSRKEHAGSLGGKVGLRRELNILRGLLRRGVVALLNDATNCLRHGDLTVVRDGVSFPFIMEVKGSRDHETARLGRQRKRAEEAYRYLATDEREMDDGSIMRRVGLETPEVNHRRVLNDVLEKAIREGYAEVRPETGLIYVATSRRAKDEDFSLIRGCSEPQVVFLVHPNEALPHFYPLSLVVRDPMAYASLCAGALVLVVAVDPGAIAAGLRQLGFKAVISEGGEPFIQLIPEHWPSGREQPRMGAYGQFFARVAFEGLSLEWMLRAIAQQAGGVAAHLLEALGGEAQTDPGNP